MSKEEQAAIDWANKLLNYASASDRHILIKEYAPYLTTLLEMARRNAEVNHHYDKCRTALMFYANPDNWDEDCTISRRCVSEGVEHGGYDLGSTAREALEGK